MSGVAPERRMRAHLTLLHELPSDAAEYSTAQVESIGPTTLHDRWTGLGLDHRVAM